MEPSKIKQEHIVAPVPLDNYVIKLNVVETLAKLQVFDYHTYFGNDHFAIVYEY